MSVHGPGGGGGGLGGDAFLSDIRRLDAGCHYLCLIYKFYYASRIIAARGVVAMADKNVGNLSELILYPLGRVEDCGHDVPCRLCG
jgi:hypothetical protein